MTVAMSPVGQPGRTREKDRASDRRGPGMIPESANCQSRGRLAGETTERRRRRRENKVDEVKRDEMGKRRGGGEEAGAKDQGHIRWLVA